MSNKVYEIVTDSITSQLKEGTVPWHKPWVSAGLPRSISTGKPYRGINVFLLNFTAQAKGYRSPFWGTYKKIAELGGQVRKGEKSTLVVFWKQLKVTETAKDGTEKDKRIPLLRYFKVFNAEQADGLPERFAYQAPTANEHRPCEAFEAIAQSYLATGPSFTHGVDGAWYSPGRDLVSIPEPEVFHTPEEYYSTLGHELGHSTGHKSRLNRPGVTEGHRFGDTSYAKEELVAELTAAFLCGVTGLEQVTLGNSASYIAGWLKALTDDPKLIVQAAAAAQKAADLIQGISYAKPETPAPDLKVAA